MSVKLNPTASASPATEQQEQHDASEFNLAHPVSMTTLLTVFGLLMALTFLTVAATWVNFGSASVWIALLIAVAKASLVALYFMHLRWDAPFNAVVLIGALFFVALFVGIAVLDAKEYQPNYTPPVRAGSLP
jgi:cytochrome c oxidase subunit 4